MLFLIRWGSPFPWTMKEMLLYLIRLIIISIATVCVIGNWKTETMGKISCTLIWVVRSTFFCAIFEQAGVDQPDTLILYLPIMYVITGGVLLTSFREYVSCCALIFLLKPAIMLWRLTSSSAETCSTTDLQTLIVQNGCLLCIAVAIFCPVFSDTRRRWLLSYEVFGPLNHVYSVTDTDLAASSSYNSVAHREGVDMQQRPRTGDGEAPLTHDL
jgi:hypothetical protein